ncbi:MAG: hypothetical protein ABFQ53_00275, partial [Patescibacteria group bacterium]
MGKIVYKKSGFLGDRAHRSGAMKKMSEADTSGVLKNSRKKQALFNEFKKIDGNATKGDVKQALANLKYGRGGISKSEADKMAKDLGVGKIEKKHMKSDTPEGLTRFEKEKIKRQELKKKSAHRLEQKAEQKLRREERIEARKRRKEDIIMEKQTRKQAVEKQRALTENTRIRSQKIAEEAMKGVKGIRQSNIDRGISSRGRLTGSAPNRP